MACTFKDAKGREWVLTLTTGHLIAARREADIDLGVILADESQERLFNLIANEHERFITLLFLLVSEQAEKRQVTPEQFAYGFDRRTRTAAAQAFMEAVADFTRGPETAAALGQVIRDMLGGIDKLTAAKVTAAVRAAESPTSSVSASSSAEPPA